MATIRLWQRFEVVGSTDHGGSFTTPVEITAATGTVHDTTTSVTTSSLKLFDVARDLGGSADFDFMWIENLSSTVTVRIQITANAGTADRFYVKMLQPLERWSMNSDDSVINSTIDALTTGSADTLDEVWAATASGTALVRVFAMT